MAKCDVVRPLVVAMKRRRDCIHLAVQCISKMYSSGNAELVAQVCCILVVLLVLYLLLGAGR